MTEIKKLAMIELALENCFIDQNNVVREEHTERRVGDYVELTNGYSIVRYLDDIRYYGSLKHEHR